MTEEADNDHLIPLPDLEFKLGTDFKKGISTEEANERLLQYGPNALTPPKKTPEWIKFCKTMFTGFAGLLWIAGILCFVAYLVEDLWYGEENLDNVYIGTALLFVVWVSGIFTYFQERKSGKIMESFKKMVPRRADVIRDGVVQSINAEDIVRGDIIQIRGGDKVPADIRILNAKSLKVRITTNSLFLWPSKKNIHFFLVKLRQ